MSDRFALHAPQNEIEQTFGISSDRADHFEPDYNITPGTTHPIILQMNGETEYRHAQWGLIPEGAEEEREGRDYFSVPAEKARGGERWSSAVEQRRCLVPANGFYKWKTSKKKQTPFYIRLLSNTLTAFAGIYSVWESPNGRPVYSFAILTTGANTLVDPVDDRMPVIVGSDAYGTWLGEEPLDDASYQSIAIEPFHLTQMAVNRVSEDVNDRSANGPELIQPIPK